MSEQPKFKPVQYGMGFNVSKEAIEADAVHFAKKPSLKPGRGWFARLACRRYGHEARDAGGRCSRCGMVLVGMFDNLNSALARNAQYVQEQLARDLFRGDR